MTISGAYAGRPAYSLHLDISVHDQDIANNRTRFDFTLYAYHDSSSTNNSYSNTARAYDASIAGSSIASGTHDFLMGPSGDFVGKTIVIASGITSYFTHNSDGTLTVSLSAYHNMSPDVQGNASASGSFTVPTIPRATQPTVSPVSGNTGSTYAIDVSTVASSAFFHDFYYSLDGGSTYTSLFSNIPATTTSENWTPAHSLLPNSTSVTAIIRVDTRSSSGGTVIGTKYVNLPLTVPSSVKPSVSSVAWVDSQVSAPDMPTLMGAAGRFVQGWSKLKPTATSSGASGSTVTETDITVNAQTVRSGVAFGSAVALSGSVPYSAVAIDSRLRSSTPLTGTVAVTPYNNPNLPAPLVARTSDAAGLIPASSGTYLAVTPAASVSDLTFGGTQKNLMEYQIRIAPKSTGVFTTVQAWTSAGGITWTTKRVFAGYSSTSEWLVEVSIRDLFGKNGYTGSVIPVQTVLVSTESIAFDFDQGLGLGINKYRQAGALDVHGDINTDGALNAATIVTTGTITQNGHTVVDLSTIATTSVAGIVPLATSAQTIAGTDTTHAVTPAGLAAKVASTSASGIVPLASSAQAIAQSDTTHALTPSNLAAMGLPKNVAYGNFTTGSINALSGQTSSAITFGFTAANASKLVVTITSRSSRLTVSISALTTTQLTIRVDNWSNATASAAEVDWKVEEFA